MFFRVLGGIDEDGVVVGGEGWVLVGMMVFFGGCSMCWLGWLYDVWLFYVVD